MDWLKGVKQCWYFHWKKNGMKKLEKAVKANDKEKANEILKTTLATIDKCASKGLMKQNTCDRQKARLNKIVKEMN